MPSRLVGIFALGLGLSGCAEQSVTVPSPSVRLVEAGWSFGFCLGPCNARLGVEADGGLAYRVVSRTGDQVFADNRGRLTPTGRDELDALLSALPEPLQGTYGCPDCADAGAAYVVVSRDGATRRSDYEYPSPPAELAALDAFLKRVMDALGGCAATARVALEGTCSPLPR